MKAFLCRAVLACLSVNDTVLDVVVEFERIYKLNCCSLTEVRKRYKLNRGID